MHKLYVQQFWHSNAFVLLMPGYGVTMSGWKQLLESKDAKTSDLFIT
jgi:hypothetical protein